MNYTAYYCSPLGTIFISCDEHYLLKLSFQDNAKFSATSKDKNNDVLNQTKRWLDLYFSGKNPIFTPPYKLNGTEFQKKVWDLLLKIPYGKTITYGEIAKEIEKETGISKMSSQAVGQAVKKNPIAIIIPCHRVIGKDGKLTGFAAGIERKIALLSLEKS